MKQVFSPAGDRRVIVAASILAADACRMADAIESVERHGADWIHVDVMDGHFVPNLSFGVDFCAAVRPHITTCMDVHLMVAPVDPWVERFAAAGADLMTAHVEAGPHTHRTLQAIRAAGVKAGVALNPGTPISAVAPLIDLVDLVLVMSVNPGFGAQPFIDVSDRVAELHQLLAGRPVHIQVDGGISPATAGRVIAAGANVLVAGTAIFAPDRAGNGNGQAERINAIRTAAPAVLRRQDAG